MFIISIPEEYQDNIDYLFKKYGRQLFYYICKIIRDPKLQEDALQESFYIISKNYNKFRDLDSGETLSYLYMIVKTTSYKIYNREKNIHTNIEFNDDFLNSASDESDIDNVIAAADLKSALNQAISQLKEDDKNLIIMRYYLDLSVKEIAELISVKENTISQKILRAKRRLAKIIKMNGGEI